MACRGSIVVVGYQYRCCLLQFTVRLGVSWMVWVALGLYEQVDENPSEQQPISLSAKRG